MGARKKAHRRTSFLARHRFIRYCLLGLAGLVLSVILLWLFNTARGIILQRTLQPFYDTAGLATEGKLGEVVRQEPINQKITGGRGQRILYRTQKSDGSYTFSSGMVFIPDTPASERQVVAWAHGTLGFGDSCAPTRTPNPPSKIPYLSEMLQKGWVIVATDYAGFGTPGTQGYLVGMAEAHDVLNSVRAARDITATHAGSQFSIWGHSQGGNSALFTASQAASYAPELQLMGTVASAPAAELPTLLNQQYETPAAWVIGPLVATSWPAVNSELNPDDILTPLGKEAYQKIAQQCIGQATLGGLLRSVLGQKFFASNPTSQPQWLEMAQAQSGPILASNQPLLVVESLNDAVVLPDTTALYIQTACSEGSDVATLWLQKAAHPDIPKKSGAAVVDWIHARFSSLANPNTCNQPLPITPASPIES